MTNPALARQDDRGHRYYTFPDADGTLRTYWSVTTLIDMGVPKYLVAWAAKITAEAAYADVDRYGRRSLRRWERAGRAEVAKLQADGFLKSLKPEKLTPRDFALRWLKGWPDRTRDAAAAIGTAVHVATEDVVLACVHDAERLLIDGEKVPPVDPALQPYLDSFFEFVAIYRPRYLMTEASVFNPEAGYAGTLDAGMELPVDGRWVRVLTDTKTGNGPYPEVGLQLSAYARAKFVGLPNYSTAPLPPFERGAVLHLTPKGFDPTRDFRWVRIDEPIFRAFLYAAEVARFRLELADSVIGDPVEPDLGLALARSLEEVAAHG